MANKNTIIKYNIGKKEYHVSVDFRENSMGIKLDSSDMLELCYLRGFYCLEDLSDKLMKIHKIEKNEKILVDQILQKHFILWHRK